MGPPTPASPAPCLNTPPELEEPLDPTPRRRRRRRRSTGHAPHHLMFNREATLLEEVAMLHPHEIREESIADLNESMEAAYTHVLAAQARMAATNKAGDHVYYWEPDQRKKIGAPASGTAPPRSANNDADTGTAPPRSANNDADTGTAPPRSADDDGDDNTAPGGAAEVEGPLDRAARHCCSSSGVPRLQILLQTRSNQIDHRECEARPTSTVRRVER
jgi:hypothetical protein